MNSIVYWTKHENESNVSVMHRQTTREEAHSSVLYFFKYDWMCYEGVCANAGPHSQKLHGRVTNICRNRMRQQCRSAMAPPQHEPTSCQIDVVSSRQVSMRHQSCQQYCIRKTCWDLPAATAHWASWSHLNCSQPMLENRCQYTGVR